MESRQRTRNVRKAQPFASTKSTNLPPPLPTSSSSNESTAQASSSILGEVKLTDSYKSEDDEDSELIIPETAKSTDVPDGTEPTNPSEGDAEFVDPFTLPLSHPHHPQHLLHPIVDPHHSSVFATLPSSIHLLHRPISISIPIKSGE